VNPIRPNLAPPVQPNAAPKPADTARIAAQKAFFDIAMGKAAPAAAPIQANAALAVETRAAAPVQRMTQAPAEAPARPLRPGSLLDIRV
jgi:hypothetical protein